MINNSLSALGRVVQRLEAKDTHIPFRDSTLTMLLRNSLGGSHRTSVVINIASEAQHADETCCALRFGERMRGVHNAATQEREVPFLCVFVCACVNVCVTVRVTVCMYMKAVLHCESYVARDFGFVHVLISVFYY